MNTDFNYSSVASLIQAAEKNNLPVSALVLSQQAQQIELDEKTVYEKMASNFQVMKECIEPGCDEHLKSTSGLTGGDAFKLRRYSESGKSLTGSFLSGALYRALAVSELNASMGRIVAAPTAGSCGILPAALITMQEEKGCSDHDCVMALFTASAVGMVIANNAPDLFGALLVVGVMGHIAIQVVLNIAVVTNTIPNTGITLPFISYGGTSVLFIMMEMGIVLSVSNRIRLEK